MPETEMVGRKKRLDDGIQDRRTYLAQVLEHAIASFQPQQGQSPRSHIWRCLSEEERLLEQGRGGDVGVPGAVHFAAS